MRFVFKKVVEKFCRFFFGRGVVVFCRGFCEKEVFWWWFFDGENVVSCVVDVVFLQSLICGWIMRHVFGIYL
jgi:hypothetical protein